MSRTLTCAALLFLLSFVGAMPAVAQSASATSAKRVHAIARLGEPKVTADFIYFDWVNPQGPKGGRVNLSGIGGFDTLNSYSFKGSQAPSLSLLDATLFTPSLDEPATSYAFVAESAEIAADQSAVTFRIRAEARFNDGRPITPDDVVFSFEEQVKANPSVAIYYRDVAKVERTGDRDVTFRFARPGNRDLPYAVSLLAVLPRHYWSAKTAGGTERSLSETTLEPPLGAGPYRIAAFDTGRSITYRRVESWWAERLPVMLGQYNFGELHYTMFRDDVPEFEALKSGDVDLNEESSSKKWATGYDVAAVRSGHLRKTTIERRTVANLQGFVFNTRRARFADPRVRRAFALAFDFEQANKSLFYGLYTRLNSTFDNSDLAHQGLPQGRELALLEKHRDKVPPEVFTTAYRSPVNATPEDQRKNLREAAHLLAEAGWKVDRGVLRHGPSGEAMTMEFLNYDTQFDRIVLPYKQALEKLGARVTLRVVDPTQYEARLKKFDFDVISDAYAMSNAPGNELRELWGSASATVEASRNRIGVKNPAVDALIEEVILSATREELIAATRALDRVILWNHYLVLQWHNPSAWIAHWAKFGRPEKNPSQDPGVLATWWYDAAAAANLEAAYAKR